MSDDINFGAILEELNNKLDRNGSNITSDSEIALKSDVNQVQSSVSSLSTQVSPKLNTSLNNLPASSKLVLTQLSLPVYANTVSVGSALPLSGSPYTAPSDGIYFCSFSKNATTSFSLYINGTARLTRNTHNDYREDQGIITVPLTKGDKIYWSNSAYSVFLNIFVPLRGG